MIGDEVGTVRGINFAAFAVGTSIAYHRLYAPRVKFNSISISLLSHKKKGDQ